MLDFLKEIVEAVPDPSAGGTIDLDGTDGAGDGKKKRGRAKKSAALVNDDGDAANGGEPCPPKKRRKKKEIGEQLLDGEKPPRKRKPKQQDVDMAEPEHSETAPDDEDSPPYNAPKYRHDEDDEDDYEDDKPYMPQG